MTRSAGPYISDCIYVQCSGCDWGATTTGKAGREIAVCSNPINENGGTFLTIEKNRRWVRGVIVIGKHSCPHGTSAEAQLNNKDLLAQRTMKD